MQPIQLPVTQVGLEQSIQAAMKKAAGTAQINLGTNSRQINALSQPLGRITGQADEFTKSMAAANARVLAFGASAGIMAGVSKALAGIVTNTIKVEKSLANINVVLNKSSSELEKFGNQLFDVAKNTGQTFDQVAEAATELARQGLSASDTLSRLNDSLILSRLSGLDATKSVEGLTAAYNSFASTGVTTAQILNKLVVVAQKYAVSEKDLIEGLKRSSAVANQAGVSLDELVGIITAVQEKTARGGAVIGNSFKTIFSRIQDRQVLSDLDNIGIKVLDLQGKVLPATTILQNLATSFKSFSQLEQADISEKLGGIYQLSNLLAAIEDLGSETSKYRTAVQDSARATNEAYSKNAALNQTLDALINKVTVSAEQLGATLGKIGVTDSLKNILSFFNGLLEGIQKILGEESALGDLFRGIAKGIGAFAAGPGLALFGAIILKLSKDLVQFGFASLKSFFGIGKAAKEVQNVEMSIQQILTRNVDLQQKLFALEGNRAGQLQLITNALVQQEALLRKTASTASSLAPAVYNVGGRATPSGLRINPPTAAGGYVPAVAKESADISRGVGGARGGDKPVVIPNFNFGGGKRGSMVAHTGEYIVPNFQGKGSAVFNRDMVRSMGLPSGARKIGAAGGFVPNFADSNFELQVQEQLQKMSSQSFNSVKTKAEKNANNPVIQEAAKRYFKSKADKQANIIDAQKILGNNMPPILTPSQSGFSESYTQNITGDKKIKWQFPAYKISGAESIVKQFQQDFSSENIRDFALKSAQKYAQMVVGLVDGAEPVDPKTIEDIDRAKGVKGFLSSMTGAFGGIFDAAITAGVSTAAQESSGPSNKDIGGDFDVNFSSGSKSSEIVKKLFGIKSLPNLNGVEIADFKINAAKGATQSMAEKVLKTPKLRSFLEGPLSNAAGGYIPNFASMRSVGYLDGDVLSDPQYADIVKAQIEKLGIKGGVAEYHKYLGDLVSQARAKNKIKKFTGVYGVPGAGKSTMMLGGAKAGISDDASLRKTNRIPIIRPEDIDKVSEVIDTRASLVGTMRALEGGYLSNVDRMMILSSSTPEEQAEIQRRRNLRDSQITAGNSKTAFGRSAGTSQGAMVDSGYIEAAALSILGPAKTAILGIKSNFGLSRKRGSALPTVEEKRIGLAYGAFSPSTKGHAELLNMARASGIPAEDFIAAVSREGGRVDPKDPHSWRTALFPQGFRKLLAKKTFAGANVIGADPNLFQGGIPSMLEVDPINGQRRFIKAGAGSMAFVGSDKTEKDLEKYIKSGYQAIVGERTEGISGTSAREAIMGLNNEAIAKIFTKDAMAVIMEYLPQLKNRSDIFPEILNRTSNKVDKKLLPVEAALAQLPSRITAKVDPATAEQILALREARDKMKKLKEKYPSIMLKKLGKLFPSKYGLPSAAGGFIPNFAEKISEKTGSDVSLQNGILKVGFLYSSRGNPLFEILKLLDQGKIKGIDAGAVIGPKIPDIIVGLKKIMERKRLKNPSIPRIPIQGFFKPAGLASKISERSEYKFKNRPEGIGPYDRKGIDYYSTKDQQNFISALREMGVDRKSDSFARLEQIYPNGLAGGYIPNFAGGSPNRATEMAKALLQKLKSASGAAKTLAFDQFLNAVLPQGISPIEQGLVQESLTQVPDAAKAAIAALKNEFSDLTPANNTKRRVFNSIVKDLIDLENGIPLRPDSYINEQNGMIQGIVSLAKIQVKRINQQARRNIGDSAAGGFLPNFANPLQAAVGREMAAGVPASQIYIDKSPSLKSAANPMGLMVANRRDEPAGGFQGINRAMREGRDPKMYGAAGGFVPNYAAGADKYKGMTRSDAIAKLEASLKPKIDESAKLYAENNKALKDSVEAIKIYKAKLENLQKTTSDADKAKKVYQNELKNLTNDFDKEKKINSELNKEKQKLQQSQKDLNKQLQSEKAAITTASTGKKGKETLVGGGKVGSNATAGNRDMLGTVFAVQGALSALGGATSDATGGIAKFTNAFSSAAGAATTFVFAGQGLSQAFGGAATTAGKLIGNLGIYGAALTGAYVAFKEFGKYMDSANPDIQKAAEASLRLAEAADKASINLKMLNPVQQENIKKRASDLIFGASRFENDGSVTQVTVDSWSSQLSDSIKSSTEQAIGAGVSQDEIFNKYRELAASDFSVKPQEAEEFLTFLTKKITDIATKISPEKAIKQLNNEQKDTLKNLSEQDFNAVIAKRSNRTAAQGLKGGQEITKLNDIFYEAGIKDDTARMEAMRKTYALIKQGEAEKIAAEKEAVDQIKISVAQETLKNALAMAVAEARRFENDALSQSLLKAKELGNLDEKSLIELENKIALRDIERKLEDETSSVIQSQIDKAKAITARKDEAVKLEEKLKALGKEGLQDEVKILEILNEANKLLSEGDDLKSAEGELIAKNLKNLFERNKLDKESLKAQQDKTEEYKEQVRQLDLISQASKRALGSQSFNREIATSKSINAANLQVRALESSKLGASDSQIRQIDKQIAAIKANTIALEQSNAKDRIFQEMKAELSENNKVTNEEIKQSLENQIKQAKTIEQLQLLSGAIFLQNKGQSEELNQSKLQDFIQKYQEQLIKQGIESEQALKQAQADINDAGRISPVIDALELFKRSLLETPQIIEQRIQDLELEKLNTSSNRRIREINYEIGTLNRQRNQTPEEAARIGRERQRKDFTEGLALGTASLQDEVDSFASTIGEQIPKMFSDNMSNAINKMIEGGESFGDSLRGAALEFLRGINQANIKNLSNQFSSFLFGKNEESGKSNVLSAIGLASGGKVRGGSGSKDDVPAMLMGGEYVINKRAVQKYGPQFFDSINKGQLGGYATGGQVQKGPQGNFYTPGTFGTGAIEGKMNLLNFATQTGTSGQFDRMVNMEGYQSIALEPESAQLSAMGMRNSPAFEATQSAKQQAFDLYLQQYRNEKEIAKAKKEQKKALKKEIMMTVGTALVMAGLQAGISGFQAGVGEAKAGAAASGTKLGIGQKLGAGFKGIYSGGKIDGQNVGGFKNLFSGVGSIATGKFDKGINQIKLSQIGSSKELQKALQNEDFAKFMNLPQARKSIDRRIAGTNINQKDFTGGGINYSEMIDEPTLLNLKEDVQSYMLPGGSPLDGGYTDGSYTGPFNAQGDYIEDWADDSSKWIKQFFGRNRSSGGGSATPWWKGLFSRATGGMIPQTSGVDTVPAMLSGGEFIMNRSAVQNIGAANLQSMNGGTKSVLTDEASKEMNDKLISKLDELIEVSSGGGDITINVSGSGEESQKSSGEKDDPSAKQELARQIKDAVIKIMEDQKRLGGRLRR